MAFFCLQPKHGAILVGVLNLTIGLPILIEFLLGHLDVMNSFSETVTNIVGNATDDATTPPNPFTTSTASTSTTTAGPEEVEDEECGWMCQYFSNIIQISLFLFVGIDLILLISQGITSIASGFQTKNQKSLAHAACLLTSGMAGFVASACILLFIFGIHWLDLLLLLIWGSIVQVYFVIVLKDHWNSVEFRPVPVSA